MAEEWEIENASTMRKGEMMFSILKEHAEEGFEIGGDGVLEVVQDGFGFLRSTAANYLPSRRYLCQPRDDPSAQPAHR